ncbi:hypothetical protein ACVBEH_19785 [Roseateles sp. GG27B]
MVVTASTHATPSDSDCCLQRSPCRFHAHGTSMAIGIMQISVPMNLAAKPNLTEQITRFNANKVKEYGRYTF